MMLVRCLQGLSIVLTISPIGIHCDFISQQFLYVVSNVSIFPNDKVFFTKELIDESTPSRTCMFSCIKNPTCFIFCHMVDGICTLGHHNTLSENTPVDTSFNPSVEDSAVAYDCYLKQQYFDSSPEDNVLLVGNESAALNKSSKSSSVYQKAVSGLALDGIKRTKFAETPITCFHTVDSDKDPQPYMVIDMAATYLVIAFNITNRSDAANYKRLHDFEIRVGFISYNNATNEGFQQNSLCFSYNDVVDGLVFFRNCYQPVAGRYISVQIVRFCPIFNSKCKPNEENKNVLCMCELDIFAIMIGH